MRHGEEDNAVKLPAAAPNDTLRRVLTAEGIDPQDRAMAALCASCGLLPAYLAGLTGASWAPMTRELFVVHPELTVCWCLDAAVAELIPEREPWEPLFEVPPGTAVTAEEWVAQALAETGARCGVATPPEAWRVRVMANLTRAGFRAAVIRGVVGPDPGGDLEPGRPRLSRGHRRRVQAFPTTG